MPYILQPTRTIGDSKLLIDNKFSNFVSHELILSNITGTTSDHLLRFLFATNILSNPSSQKCNFYEIDCKFC